MIYISEKSIGKLENVSLQSLEKQSAHIGYSEKMLKKYYQFLDTINKKYDNDNDVKVIKKKEKVDKEKNVEHNIIFTIKEEHPTMKNDSSSSLVKVETDLARMNKSKKI
jgi:hypothetical protein